MADSSVARAVCPRHAPDGRIQKHTPVAQHALDIIVALHLRERVEVAACRPLPAVAACVKGISIFPTRRTLNFPTRLGTVVVE